jgi:hypothetical protein
VLALTIITLFAYAEIWLILILMLICCERKKTFFVGSKVVQANRVISIGRREQKFNML